MASEFPPIARPTPGASETATAPASAPAKGAKGTLIAWPHVAFGIAGIGAGLWAVHLHALVMAGRETGCGISETISCDKVLGSQYGEFLGIPLGIYGALFWAIVLLFSFSSAQTPPRSIAWQRFAIATVGLVTSLALAFISLGVLRHFCPVCATTHVLSGLNFLVAARSVWKLRA